MDLILNRTWYSKGGVFGELKEKDGDIIAVTLEHAYEHDGEYSPKIPDGLYTCLRGLHNLEHMTEWFETFQIAGVIGHTNLLFHWGNYNNESEGCILLGRSIKMDGQKRRMVTDSKKTFAKFMELQKSVNNFKLTVT